MNGSTRSPRRRSPLAFAFASASASALTSALALALAMGVATSACHEDDASHEASRWIDSPSAAPALAGLGVVRGTPFRLSDERGRVVVLSFGYTSCLEVCPDTFAKMKAVMNGLGEGARAVEFDYVTVDPERDTPDRFREFVRGVDPRFEGIYVAPAELPATLSRYDVVARKRLPDPARYAARNLDAAAFYAMDHTSGFWLVDREGRLRAHLAHEAPSEEVLAGVRRLLADGGAS